MRTKLVTALAVVGALSLGGGFINSAWPQAASGDVLVKTAEPVDLSSAAGEVTARLSPQLIQKIGKGGESVRLVGSARGVKAGAGSQSTIGQIVWNGVTADVNGRKRVAPLDKPLTSQFVTRATTVPSGTDVKAAGDEAAIIAAARKLFDVPAEETRKADSEKKETRPKNAAPVGGGGSSNDLAANGYQPAPAVMKPEKVELPTAYGTTTEGCMPRVDEAQGVVILQARQTTTTGGVVSSAGACSDTMDRYNIQKSYASCGDRLDTAARKAYAQFRKYWTDDQGRTSYLGDCVDDRETVFDMTDDVAACSYDVDFSGMMAFERAELVYTNRSNQRVLVEGCQRTAKAGLPVTKSVDGCTFRHDFTAHVSYQKKKMVYTDPNNAVVAVTECADDPQETYAHVDVRNVCSDLVDQASGKAWPQRRWQIQPPTGALWISECEPVQESATDLVATVEGCESIFFHYIDAGQSFGAQRFYYSFDGATRTYVTGCEQSTVAYPHQTEIQGYEYHDPEKYGLPKTALYINTGVGRVDVSPAQVRAGAAHLPYIYVRQTTAALPDQKYWEGCNAYAPTALTDVYKRPDNTEVSYAVGAGTPTGPVDECSRVTQTQTVYAYTNGAGYPTHFWIGFNGASLIRWPLSGAGNAAIGQGYNMCSGGSSRSPVSATFTHFLQNQSRVVTTYPNDGGTTYSAWSNVGAAYAQSNFSCTEIFDAS